MEITTPDNNNNGIRRGQVLGEISQIPNMNNMDNQTTPKSSSPDEMVIQQRGPRVMPLTWSPVDCNKMNILAPPRDKTPERNPVKELRPRLRRRLTLSPVKGTNLNNSFGKRY
ncbi:hypothetical protein CBL_01435 [Carabus blaptoides fortunei]